MYIPTFEDVKAARERIRPYVHRTPVLTSSYLNGLTGAELFFKCENFQKAGAFKVRGASNAVFGLADEQAKRGVATHSSGNHALSPQLRRGEAGHPRHGRDAEDGAGGEEGRRARVWRNGDHECEPSTAAPRGGLAGTRRPDGGGLRSSLQRSAGDRRAGDVLAGASWRIAGRSTSSSPRSAAAA